MSALGDTRSRLTTALEALDPQPSVYDHVPERPAVPAAVVLPATPYVTPDGGTYGKWLGRFVVALLVPGKVNSPATDQLDALICDVLPALEDADFSVAEVSTFYSYSANGAQYLAADVTATDSISIGD
jgi:hypothetical protein